VAVLPADYARVWVRACQPCRTNVSLVHTNRVPILERLVDSPEWREDKGGLGWFRSFSPKGSWDRLKQESLTDEAHLCEKRFEFSVLCDGLLKEFSLLGR